jgi:predicted metal-binding membrane protein
MLQLASQQRCDAVAARIAATLLQLAVLRQFASLRHCCSRRCSNAVALL